MKKLVTIITLIIFGLCFIDGYGADKKKKKKRQKTIRKAAVVHAAGQGSRSGQKTANDAGGNSEYQGTLGKVSVVQDYCKKNPSDTVNCKSPKAKKAISKTKPGPAGPMAAPQKGISQIQK